MGHIYYDIKLQYHNVWLCMRDKDFDVTFKFQNGIFRCMGILSWYRERTHFPSMSPIKVNMQYCAIYEKTFEYIWKDTNDAFCFRKHSFFQLLPKRSILETLNACFFTLIIAFSTATKFINFATCIFICIFLLQWRNYGISE